MGQLETNLQTAVANPKQIASLAGGPESVCVCVYVCVCVGSRVSFVQFALQAHIWVFESSLAAIARVHLAAPTRNLNNDEDLWTGSHNP